MSNKAPLVSVCIPAYNHEKYIEDCINSIIEQTYENLELIIIDDGSKDGTYQEIKKLMPKLEKRFVRVSVETQENMGTCRTINKLYRKARGKYIYHIASDDISKPDAIETLIKFLEQNPEYALVVGDNEIINGDGEHVYWDAARNNVHNKADAIYHTFGEFLKSQKKHIDFNSNQFGTYETLFYGNYIPNGYLIRRSILEKISPFTTEAPLEDWWFMMQVSKHAKIKYIDEVLFSYRWHDTNTIKNTQKILDFVRKTHAYEIKTLITNTPLNFLKLDKYKHNNKYLRIILGATIGLLFVSIITQILLFVNIV